MLSWFRNKYRECAGNAHGHRKSPRRCTRSQLNLEALEQRWLLFGAIDTLIAGDSPISRIDINNDGSYDFKVTVRNQSPTQTFTGPTTNAGIFVRYYVDGHLHWDGLDIWEPAGSDPNPRSAPAPLGIAFEGEQENYHRYTLVDTIRSADGWSVTTVFSNQGQTNPSPIPMTLTTKTTYQPGNDYFTVEAQLTKGTGSAITADVFVAGEVENRDHVNYGYWDPATHAVGAIDASGQYSTFIQPETGTGLQTVTYERWSRPNASPPLIDVWNTLSSGGDYLAVTPDYGAQTVYSPSAWVPPPDPSDSSTYYPRTLGGDPPTIQLSRTDGVAALEWKALTLADNEPTHLKYSWHFNVNNPAPVGMLKADGEFNGTPPETNGLVISGKTEDDPVVDQDGKITWDIAEVQDKRRGERIYIGSELQPIWISWDGGFPSLWIDDPLHYHYSVSWITGYEYYKLTLKESYAPGVHSTRVAIWDPAPGSEEFAAIASTLIVPETSSPIDKPTNVQVTGSIVESPFGWTTPQVTVNWAGVNPVEADGVVIERRIGNGPFRQIGSIENDQSSYVDSEITLEFLATHPHAELEYRLRAYDGYVDAGVPKVSYSEYDSSALYASIELDSLSIGSVSVEGDKVPTLNGNKDRIRLVLEERRDPEDPVMLAIFVNNSTVPEAPNGYANLEPNTRYRGPETIPNAIYKLADLTDIVVNSGAGDDAIILDFSNGAFAVPITINAGAGDDALTVTGNGNFTLSTSQVLGSLTVSDGATLTLAHGQTIQTNNITITSGGKLDLKDNNMIVVGGDYWAIFNLLKSARAGSPRWEGPGIGTSSPRENGKPDQGLAIGEAGGNVNVKFTWNGDLNLDGRVNADDYFYIDQGFLQKPQPPKYHDGDFNFDGKINADDYFLIDQAFLNQKGVVLGSGPGLTVDLRVRSTQAKTAQVTTVGQIVTIGVYATVTGTDPLAFQGLQSLQGGFTSTNVNLGAAKGNLDLTYFRNYFGGSASQEGTMQDLDGDGDLDIGGSNPSDLTNYFVARAAGMQTGEDPGVSMTIEIATLKFTVTELLDPSGTTELNFFKRDEIDEAALWQEDDIVVNNGSSANFQIADALVLYR